MNVGANVGGGGGGVNMPTGAIGGDTTGGTIGRPMGTAGGVACGASGIDGGAGTIVGSTGFAAGGPAGCPHLTQNRFPSMIGAPQRVQNRVGIA